MTIPMPLDKFASVLEKGLGRPHVYLQSQSDEPYRETILHACTHDLVYDKQCEDHRGPYLFELIQLTSDPLFYSEPILRALPLATEGRIIGQLAAIARRMAQNGDSAARQALYSTVLANTKRQEFNGAEELIELDGLEGFLSFAPYYIGSPPDDLWEFGYSIGRLEDRIGKEEAWTALESAAVELPALKTLIDAVRRDREESRLSVQNRRQNVPSDPGEFKTIFEKQPKHAVGLSLSWSRLASDEAVERAARDFLAEEDPDRLRAYLRVFERRRFPLDHGRLLLLAKSSNDDLAWRAIRALARISHPSIRALAMELASDPDRCGEAVRLFAANYQGGDHTLVESILNRPLRPDAYHALGYGVFDVVDAHPDSCWTDTLELLYQNGPCSICRGGAIKRLQSLDALREWMRQECCYDADTGTREMVAGAGGRG